MRPTGRAPRRSASSTWRGGRVTRKRRVARGLPDVAYVSVAANARGDEVAAWQRSERQSTSPVHLAVRRSRSRVHSRLISHRGSFSTAPALAIARSGATVAAWATTRGTLLVSGRQPG